MLQGVITDLPSEKAVYNLIKALGKCIKSYVKDGHLHNASYTGAQVFEALGLSQELIDEYFVGTTSRLGGVGLDVIAEETIKRHHIAYPPGGRNPQYKASAHRGASINGAEKASRTFLILKQSLPYNMRLAQTL